MFKGNFSHIHTRIFTSVVFPCIYDEGKKTKITNGDPLQLTVISNILENIHFNPENEDYIIIPFPLIKGKNRVKIIDLENYPKIFEDLSLTFTDLDKKENNYNTIGKYEVEFLSKIDDLDLSYEIKENYSQGFGFIKCHPRFFKFKSKDVDSKDTKAEFLPFAYVHEINLDTKLFIPTKIISLTNKYIKPANAASSDLAGVVDELDNSTNDKFISWFLKKKEKIVDPIIKSDNKSFEIYITNFPRVVKNPLLTQSGVKVMEKKIKEKHDLFLSKSKFPKNLEIKKIEFIHQINIDEDYKFNHNLLC